MPFSRPRRPSAHRADPAPKADAPDQSRWLDHAQDGVGNAQVARWAAGDAPAAAVQPALDGAAPFPHEARLRQSFGDRWPEGAQARTGNSARAAAQLLGAEAVTAGDDVAFAGAPDLSTAAHEAAHVAQQRAGGPWGDAGERQADAVAAGVARGERVDGLVPEARGAASAAAPAQLREATWIERRAWLAFFDHYLPRKFLNNYMDDTGAAITLTAQEMEDCNPIVDIRRSEGFMAEVARLQGEGGGTASIDTTGWGGARTNGTLGNFTVHYEGVVSVAEDGSWTFSGMIWFYDYWDFNTGGANRPAAAELKVIVANAFLPGQPFAIDSERVIASQTDGDGQVNWGAAAPVHVPDNMERTATDIGVGVDVGTPGADFGEVGGGEVGAQSSEDLN